METSKKSPKVHEKTSRDADDKSDLYDQKMLKHRKDLGVRHFERFVHNDGEFRNEEKSCGIVDLDSGMNGTRARYGPPNRSIGAPALALAPAPVPALQSYESPRGQPSTPQSQWKKPFPSGTDITTPSTHRSHSTTTNSPSFSTPPMSSLRSFPTTPQGVSSPPPQRGLTSLNERMDLAPYIPKTPTPSRTNPNNSSEYRSNRGMTSSPSGPPSPPLPSTPQKNTASYIAEHSRNDPSCSILKLNDASPDRLNGERNVCIERSRGASNYTRRNECSTEHSAEPSPHRDGPPIRNNNSEERSSPKASRAFTRNSPGMRQSSRFDHSAMKDVNSAQRHRRYEGELDGRASMSPDNVHYQRERNRNNSSALPVVSSNNTQGNDDDEDISRDFENRVAAAAERNRRSHNQSLPHVSCSLVQPQDSPQNVRRPSVTSPSQPHSLDPDPSRSLMRAALSANMHLRNLTSPSPGPGPFLTPQYIPPIRGSLSPVPLPSPLPHTPHVPQGGDDQAGPGKSVESSPPRGSVYRQTNKK